MNEINCWYCDTVFSYDDPKYRDIDCPNCGLMNSVYNPALQGKEEQQSNPTTETEWLNAEAKVANLGDLRKNLVKEDVQTGDIILFVDAGEIKDVDFSKIQDGSDVKTVFQVMVELPDGKNKIYTPNATTRGILSGVWGENTELWIGKKASVKFVDQLSFGKLTKVMVLEPAT